MKGVFRSFVSHFPIYERIFARIEAEYDSILDRHLTTMEEAEQQGVKRKAVHDVEAVQHEVNGSRMI